MSLALALADTVLEAGSWAAGSPLLVVAVAALVAWFVPRAAVPVGVLATAGSLAWFLLVPDGSLVQASFLGFEVAPVHVDGLSRVVGVVFAGIGVLAVLYAASVEAGYRLVSFALAYVASSMGAVLAGDWLSLVVWWEVMAVTSTLVVWHHGGRAVRAGFRYAVLHGIGGSLVLMAVVLHAARTGTLVYSGGGVASGVASVLAALGMGVNVGFVGLHAWLPDTYPSPSVAASVFLCVYTTKTGVYALLRAFPDGHLVVAFMGAAMAVFGVTYALFQDDMRRLLSYHIQSQVGYMVAGVGMGSALAQTGAIAHVFNHIVYKALLFMVAGMVIYRTGFERLSKVGGLYRAMPWTFGAFVVAALSIAGFPGFNGFVSKGMVTDAASYDAGSSVLYWALVVASVGTFLSFIKLGYSAFVEEAPEGFDAGQILDAPVVGRGVMGAAAFVCILLGVVPGVLFGLIDFSPTAVYEGVPEVHPYSFSHVQKGVVTGLVGLVGYVLVKKPLGRLKDVRDVDALYNPVVFYATRAVLGLVGRIRRGVDAGYERSVAWLGGVLEDPLPGEDAPIGLGVFLVTASLVVALAVALL